MKLFLFSVRDICVGVCNPPFAGNSLGAGHRMFGDAIQKGEDSLLRQHPEHFDLLHVGYFDDQSGAVEHVDKVIVATAMEFMKPVDRYKELESAGVVPIRGNGDAHAS